MGLIQYLISLSWYSAPQTTAISAFQTFVSVSYAWKCLCAQFGITFPLPEFSQYIQAEIWGYRRAHLFLPGILQLFKSEKNCFTYSVHAFSCSWQGECNFINSFSAMIINRNASSVILKTLKKIQMCKVESSVLLDIYLI